MDSELLESPKTDVTLPDGLTDELQAIASGSSGQPAELTPEKLSNHEVLLQFKSSFQAAFSAQLPERIRMINEYEEDKLAAPPLNDALRQRLIGCGLSAEIINSLYASWMSFQSERNYLERHDVPDYEKIPKDVTEIIVANQTEAMMIEVGSFLRFNELYGDQECQQIIEVFGIHHFSRYTPELLHEQLIMWQNGERPVQNIAITAHYDWSGAAQTIPAQHMQLFDEAPIFFEVSTPTELAQVAVAVGSRERVAGRDPETGNYVKNFIITAHADETFLAFGPDEKGLSTEDYKEAAKSRTKINGGLNTYRKHLGHEYNVILLACSTGGIVFPGSNIAETISNEHDTQVQSSPVEVSNILVLHPDGRVEFESGSEKVLSSRYNGRDGSGITREIPLRSRMRSLIEYLKK